MISRKQHIEKVVHKIFQEMETNLLLGIALDCMSEPSRIEFQEKLKEIIREEIEREPTWH